MNEVQKIILVEGRDNSYREVQLIQRKVVLNKRRRDYSEYVGDEYLKDGDTVVEALVAE